MEREDVIGHWFFVICKDENQGVKIFLN